MEPAEVYALIEEQLGDKVWDVKAVAGEGLRLGPSSDLSIEELEELVVPIIQEANWIVTSLRNGLLIEPRYTRLLNISQETELFHVAYRANRAEIEAAGLQLGVGGNTRLARKYPPRIFVALGMVAAEKFIDFQSRSTRVSFRGGHAGRAEPIRTREEFDIWRVSRGVDIQFYSDILFPDEAGWTETPFPRDQIELVQ